MADTGWRSPTLGESIAKQDAQTHWSYPHYIYISDDMSAFAGLVQGYHSHWLRATDFGFTIPIGVIIDGIVVEFEKKSTQPSTKDWQVKIVKAGVESGTNKPNATDWPTSSDIYTSYGSSADKWGLTWTPAQINADNFGISIACVNNYGSTVYARIDHIRIKVYYHEPSTNMKVNIGDVWKDAAEIKINIADTWKPVIGIWINIGDSWKKVFD